uniref:Uncharacterized protein n=1 Tax=Siphoviridae sp. ctVzN31 TaxID=2825534 RepID=A0A8S5NYL5_9CAUD|nr:MAG TPA: hypothetical protein [Siphoviridae sp. ctVzN31]
MISFIYLSPKKDAPCRNRGRENQSSFLLIMLLALYEQIIN